MAKVQLQTSMGNITLTLNDELAPKSTENFLAYVRSGHTTALFFIASSPTSWFKAAV